MEVTMSDRDSVVRIAYHEAGHTVVARSLGIEVEGVSIVEDEDSHGRSLSPLREGFDYYGDEDADEHLEDHLLVCLAGAVAEEKLTGKRPELEGNDRQGAGDILIRIAPGTNGAKMEESIDRARDILSENWSNVTTLAEALLEHGKLSAGQVRTLLIR